MVMRTLFLCLALLLVAPTFVSAEKNAKLAPVLVKTGTPSEADDFEGDAKTLGKQWAANKGDWKIEDGVMVGKELAADKHAAVVTWKVPNRNSAIRCSFQLKGTKGFHLSLNHPKGHLFRIIVTQKGMVLRTDKNKKDPKSKPIKLAQASSKIEQGKWYTLLLEMQGEKVVAQIDDILKVEGHHPCLDVEKTGYRFVMKGDSLLLDDVTAWKIP